MSEVEYREMVDREEHEVSEQRDPRCSKRVCSSHPRCSILPKHNKHIDNLSFDGYDHLLI